MARSLSLTGDLRRWARPPNGAKPFVPDVHRRDDLPTNLHISLTFHLGHPSNHSATGCACASLAATRGDLSGVMVSRRTWRPGGLGALRAPMNLSRLNLNPYSVSNVLFIRIFRNYGSAVGACLGTHISRTESSPLPLRPVASQLLGGKLNCVRFRFLPFPHRRHPIRKPPFRLDTAFLVHRLDPLRQGACLALLMCTTTRSMGMTSRMLSTSLAAADDPRERTPGGSPRPSSPAGYPPCDSA